MMMKRASGLIVILLGKNCNKEHLHPTSFKSFSMTGSKKRLSTVVSFENENNNNKKKILHKKQDPCQQMQPSWEAAEEFILVKKAGSMYPSIPSPKTSVAVSLEMNACWLHNDGFVGGASSLKDEAAKIRCHVTTQNQYRIFRICFDPMLQPL